MAHAVELREFVRHKHPDGADYEVRYFTRDGIEGLLMTGGVPRERADWCDTVESVTGLDVNERNRAAVGLVLMRTAHGVYALSYGVGHHILDLCLVRHRVSERVMDDPSLAFGEEDSWQSV
ncbi:DUF6119 family protein [Streptomyces sp. AB3(2024)]|uniref:DUF6119 family protein n=1 Tax=Streptomyces sp. AB3(2024) TaxID=3317321 RepID=UPI0035A3AD47